MWSIVSRLSIFPPLVLCFCDLDFLPQVLMEEIAEVFADIDVAILVLWVVVVKSLVALLTGLAAVLILLSPTSKHWESERAIF